MKTAVEMWWQKPHGLPFHSLLSLLCSRKLLEFISSNMNVYTIMSILQFFEWTYMMFFLKGVILFFHMKKRHFSIQLRALFCFLFYLMARRKGLFVIIGVRVMLELAGSSDLSSSRPTVSAGIPYAEILDRWLPSLCWNTNSDRRLTPFSSVLTA